MASQIRSPALLDRLPVKQGALAGLGAFVTGMLVTVTLLVFDAEVSLSGDGREVLNTIAWWFYSAHYPVGIDLPWGRSTSLIADGSQGFPDLVYYLVPVAILIPIGYLIATATPVTTGTPRAAILGGASVVVGYFPTVAIGTLVFTESEGGWTVRPAIVESLVVAGVVYPLVFGAIGGALAYASVKRRDGGSGG